MATKRIYVLVITAALVWGLSIDLASAQSQTPSHQQTQPHTNQPRTRHAKRHARHARHAKRRHTRHTRVSRTGHTRPARQAKLSQSTVKHAQQALKDKGYYNGHVNGVMDTNTRNALRRYQQDQGLSAGGRLTTETAEHLGIVAHGDHTDGSAVEQFEAAGSAIKTHYGTAGKEMGRGAKHMGSDVKKGHVVEGGKQLGKGAGRFGKHVGKGTAKAAKHTGKGVKKAVTPDHDKQ